MIGAGCIGAAIARELAKSCLRVVLVESSDDVTQGATKANSGIVHAGFDDAPGSTRARLCWPGNQAFTQLDKELRFGLNRNGSLVVAKGAEEEATLRELLARGATNGVARLRIIDQAELRAMEPAIHPDATAALFSPDAATLTPYEFAIALAENAVDNGVELRLNTRLVGLTPLPDGGFVLGLEANGTRPSRGGGGVLASLKAWAGLLLPLVVALAASVVAVVAPESLGVSAPPPHAPAAAAALGASVLGVLALALLKGSGGSVSPSHGQALPGVRARWVVNAAGLHADKVAKLVGDNSFTIKPRIGEYLLLNKSQGGLSNHILFPTVRGTARWEGRGVFPVPHTHPFTHPFQPSKMGKGVLVQTTLWGNSILGPTAVDLSDPTAATRTPAEIMTAILSKCRELVPSLDAGETFHTFSGLRAKSTRGDWVIESCTTAPDLVHAAGIDSPGVAGSPAIAAEVVRLLRERGMPAKPDPKFVAHRRPIIVVKDLAKGLAAEVKKDGSCVTHPIKLTGTTPDTLVVRPGLQLGGVTHRPSVNRCFTPLPPPPPQVCKCEKVLESEIVDAIHRSLPCESTQAVRKRTRAGMGHCQAEYCESRVCDIIARETGIPVANVPRRPWPATSILPQRWLSEEEKDAIRKLA